MSRFVARFCLAVAVMGLALAGASPSALAQSGVDADGDGVADGSVPSGASVDAYPSGVGVAFVPADVQPSSDPAAGAVGGTGGGDAGAGLAVTGDESELTMAIAVGLLAVGGASLVTSRRRLAST